jgi:hypothetical protein
MIKVERNGNGTVALVPGDWRDCNVQVFVHGINAKIAVRAAIDAYQHGDMDQFMRWQGISIHANRSHFEPKGKPFPVSPPWIGSWEKKASRGHMHDKWHAEVRSRVRLQAELYAAGDDNFEIMADIYEWAMQFDSSMSKPEPTVHDDTSCWWWVGRNASHSFYVGFMPDGSYGTASFGEPAGYDVEDDDGDGYVEADWWFKKACARGGEGYMGHF